MPTAEAKSALLRSQTSAGASLLHLAAFAGLLSVVDFLTDHLTREHVLSCIRDSAGRTPVHYAVMSTAYPSHADAGDASLGFILDLAIADDYPQLLAPDDKNRTALHWAAHGSNVPAIRLLASRHPEWLTAEDHMGWTPLLTAAKFGEEGAIRALVEAGGSAVLAETRAKRYPLHFAVERGLEASTKQILAADKSSALLIDKDQHTPLHIACLRDRVQCLRLLAPASAEVINRYGPDGRAPLHIVLESPLRANSLLNAVKILVDSGADVSLPLGDASAERKGETPLAIATKKGHAQNILKLLGLAVEEEGEKSEEGATPGARPRMRQWRQRVGATSPAASSLAAASAMTTSKANEEDKTGET